MDGQQIDKRWKCLFWDLDGTITDSGEGIMKSAQVALAHYGIEVEDWRTLRPFVGPPLEDSFQMFYGFTYEQSIEAMEISLAPQFTSLSIMMPWTAMAPNR